jgi:hypothetical protein
MAVVYACLVVRSYFLAESDSDLARAALMQSRATLCEILAIKLLSRFASNHIQLVAVLTTRWNPLAGATYDIVDQVKSSLGHEDDADMDSQHTALEVRGPYYFLSAHPSSLSKMAISTQAKAFLASPISQRVVHDIYYGRIVFTIAGRRSILADNYKPRAIELYDYRSAPFIDHYRYTVTLVVNGFINVIHRLRVPYYGGILEFLNVVVLLLTFVLCLSSEFRIFLIPISQHAADHDEK